MIERFVVCALKLRWPEVADGGSDNVSVSVTVTVTVTVVVEMKRLSALIAMVTDITLVTANTSEIKANATIAANGGINHAIVQVDEDLPNEEEGVKATVEAAAEVGEVGAVAVENTAEIAAARALPSTRAAALLRNPLTAPPPRRILVAQRRKAHGVAHPTPTTPTTPTTGKRGRTADREVGQGVNLHIRMLGNRPEKMVLGEKVNRRCRREVVLEVKIWQFNSDQRAINASVH